MKSPPSSASGKDPWEALLRFTSARIALGRTGTSQTVRTHLEFQMAHARAKDSVKLPLDFEKLEKDLELAGIPTVRLKSRAGDRAVYLQRPDLGRLLNRRSEKKLRKIAEEGMETEIVIAVADGLSSAAIERHVPPFLSLLIRELKKRAWKTAPICLVEQGRVAVGDPVGEALSARMSIVIIGERPGLSSPDSMGIYLTYNPRNGATDADRNCISNIHAGGLSYEAALAKLLFLIEEAFQRKLSGVGLKEEMPEEIGEGGNRRRLDWSGGGFVIGEQESSVSCTANS